MKKFLSLFLSFVLIFSLMVPSALAAGGSLEATYSGNKVTVTASNLKANHSYDVISVRSSTSVMGLGSGRTDPFGKLTAEIPVGTLQSGTYQVHIYNREDGTVAVAGSFTVGGSGGGSSSGGGGGGNGGGGSHPTPNTPNSFIDVHAGDYYYDAVNWAVKHSVAMGTSKTTFSPMDSCTRAQALTFLWRSLGSPKESGKNIFTDVMADAYYVDAIRWAVAKDVAHGVGGSLFDPDGTVTRGQFVTFLWKAMGSPKTTGQSIFRDVSPDAYFHDAVLWAAEKGVTHGVAPDLFAPDAPCLRGQIVVFLYNYLGK